MILSAIVAATENGVIGKGGKMPWHLPDEGAYFRQTTLGHPVITGRKNFDAMGRALPGRLNVIITRQPDYYVPFQNCVVVHSLEDALNLPQVKAAKEAFIIGGQQIYDEAMPQVQKLYLTIVHTKMDGDTFFNYDPKDWKIISTKEHPADAAHKFAYTITVQERKRKSDKIGV